MASTIVVTCSGASNTGTVADRVTREIVAEYPYEFDMLCLPALALGRKNAMEKVRNAERVVIIDGCPTNCARKILEKAGFEVDKHYEISKGFGVDKTPFPTVDDSLVEKVKGMILDDLRGRDDGGE